MPKTAFIFPGQGSQTLGLLSTLINHFPIIESTFDEASQILGYDVWQLAQKGPLSKMNETVYTQPLILTASVALWRAWFEQTKVLPHYFAGHSLGEYTAYTCAGSMSFEQAVQLVSYRGLYMQEAVLHNEGAMAAIIGLKVEKIHSLCQAAHHYGHVSLANYNTPIQVVISGHLNAVNHVIQSAKLSGAKLAKKIPVSVPAHCDLMRAAAQRLSVYLQDIPYQTPRVSVLNTTTLQILKEPKNIKKTLIKQLYSPVRWSESIQWLIQQGVECFIECGPGQVLSRLITQIAPYPVTIIAMHEYEGFCKAVEHVVPDSLQ